MALESFSHTRIVAWLKVILPVAALVLLSTMFLVSKSTDPTTSLTYARINLDELTGEQRISNPRFSSVTKDGAALNFSAESAIPSVDRENHFVATGLVASIATPDGAEIAINAAAAEIDGRAKTVALSGGVTVQTSTHYEIEAMGLTTSMDATHILTDGPVTAKSPMGTLSAGSAVLTQAESDQDAYLLVFKNGVKMVYTPRNPEDRQ